MVDADTVPEPARRTGPTDAIAAVVVPAASFGLVWWLVGDLSSDGFAADQLDYIFGRLDIDRGIERAIDVVATCLFVLGAIVVFRRWSAGALASRRVAAIALAALGTALAAMCLRVMTAGTIGANIGGGFAALFGFPLIVGLFASAAVLWFRDPVSTPAPSSS